MKSILVVVKSYDHVKFFNRMKFSLEEQNYRMLFITWSYAAYRLLKENNEIVYLIKKSQKHMAILDENLAENTLEYKAKKFSKQLVCDLYNSTFVELERLKDISIEYVFIWNGCEIIDVAVTKWASIKKIKTLYFEIGNFPGKLFVDSLGTNASSELYKNKNVLAKYSIDIQKYNCWKNDYIKSNLKKHIVKQSNKIFSSKSQFFWNRFGELFVTGFFSISSINQKLSNFFKHKLIHIKYEDYEIEKNKYILFPLQVVSDTQVVVHSDIGLKEAIAYAIKKSKYLGCDLLVKPHPAECDQGLVSLLKNNRDIHLVNYNTFKLIENAEEVITINSTVGLEAKIMNKNVTVLGKTFYKSFEEYDIARYVNRYLINVDYFSNDEINLEKMKEILSRAKEDSKCRL